MKTNVRENLKQQQQKFTKYNESYIRELGMKQNKSKKKTRKIFIKALSTAMLKPEILYTKRDRERKRIDEFVCEINKQKKTKIKTIIIHTHMLNTNNKKKTKQNMQYIFTYTTTKYISSSRLRY